MRKFVVLPTLEVHSALVHADCWQKNIAYYVERHILIRHKRNRLFFCSEQRGDENLRTAQGSNHILLSVRSGVHCHRLQCWPLFDHIIFVLLIIHHSPVIDRTFAILNDDFDWFIVTNHCIVPYLETNEGWNTPKYCFNRRLSHEVHHWATFQPSNYFICTVTNNDCNAVRHPHLSLI